MNTPAVEIRYSGELQVRPYRRGTYLGDRHLEAVIERALGSRFSFGEGWRGQAEITIRFFDVEEREHAA
ncbi:MAG TPA: hypothetical protein VNH40_11390 [Gaiellaceae bacterium]|nr:hypothetical protein [Gaiellaceae bacterium]